MTTNDISTGDNRRSAASGVSRRAVTTGAAWTVPVIAVGAEVSQAAASALQTFTFTTSQTKTIPPARNITITVNGASAGASGSAAGTGGAGGSGGQVVWQLAGPTTLTISAAIIIGTRGQIGNTATTGTITPVPGGAGYSAGGSGGVRSTTTTGTNNGGGSGGGSTGVTLSGPATGTLVGAGGGGGSGALGLGGSGGNAAGANGAVSPGANGISPNPTPPTTAGLGGGQSGNVGTPSYASGGGPGKDAQTPQANTQTFGGGGGGGGVVGGLGGQPTYGSPASATTSYSAGGGGGESGSSVTPAGTVSFGTGAAGATNAAGSNGSVVISYIA